ncbi:MAG: DUF4350 domain-containing protein [Rhodanobacteraceae bacterium]
MRASLSTVLRIALLLAVAGCLAFLSTRFGFERDWSANRRASLAPASVALLHALHAPVEVISYARPQGTLRAVITQFIERYRRVKPDLALRFVDPDADPGAMRTAGITLDGELEIRYRDRSERLKVLSEAEFSGALQRLARARDHVVAFLEGEGERQPDGKANADLGQFSALLADQGIRSLPLALASSGRVPENTDLLVIADPQVALAPNVVSEIDDYLARGGNLLWLTEPGKKVGLDPLARNLSLRVLAGTVVDGGGQAFGIGDPSFVAISKYPDHAITRDFALTTLFPQPAALGQLTGTQWKFASILRSSAKSWTETGPILKAGDAPGNIRYDADAGEIPGPLDLAFALTRLSPRPGKREQRVVVIGDGDFLSNSFLGNGGNREFGQRVFDWLLGDDSLIAVPDRSAPDRELNLSQVALDALGLTFLIGIPALLVIVGGSIRWRRRRR